jgi:hypothetical protein
MDTINESARREAMLAARGFYASRLTVDGPLKIREKLEGRGVPSGYYVLRTITTIGDVDITNHTDQEIYDYLMHEVASSSANANAEPTYHELGFKPRSRSDNTRESERAAKVTTTDVLSKITSINLH